jgi:hypothetical protein
MLTRNISSMRVLSVRGRGGRQECKRLILLKKCEPGTLSDSFSDHEEHEGVALVSFVAKKVF